MAQKQFTRRQGIVIITVVVVGFTALLWGASSLIRRDGGPAAPREMQPIREQVAAGNEQATRQVAAPSSDADARRQEILQNLKYSATHGNR